MRGLYVHIPFCVKKCSYCDFYSLPARLDTMESYIQAVLQEAEYLQKWSYRQITVLVILRLQSA